MEAIYGFNEEGVLSMPVALTALCISLSRQDPVACAEKIMDAKYKTHVGSSSLRELIEEIRAGVYGPEMPTTTLHGHDPHEH